MLPAGCGGNERGETSGRQATLAQRGAAVFVAACARCHTLTGHDSRAAGGDLAIAELSAGAVESFVHVMPVHLTRAEEAAVAAYVDAAAARRHR